MPAKLEEKSCLVVFEPTEEYCMCKATDELSKQLHTLATTQSRHYSYEAMNIAGRGYMVVSFNTNQGKHKQELQEVLSKVAEIKCAEGTQNVEANQNSKKCVVLKIVEF